MKNFKKVTKLYGHGQQMKNEPDMTRLQSYVRPGEKQEDEDL